MANKYLRVSFLLIMIIVALGSVFGWLKYKENKNFMIELLLHKPISKNDIKDTKASKVIYKSMGSGMAKVEHVEINITEEEINKLISWFNSVPVNSVHEVGSVEGSIIAGIVLDMRSGSEVRIQYNSINIYVTRNDIKGKGIYIKYIIEHDYIREFFEGLTKGYYFGRDKVA
ncbi:hypothetical protein [Paenibacillus beijingensis]|uniref:Uncharacterized protein n=1 Tax=Paenibacillus beijingensis TaxID=1126833 RepID=A0A0D5NMI2_9BACL|nr:hypothetical protein [Paenibacillus beijingensis]AJY76187.1 hypothetical protein VN24_18490 [Paenibacillus beijingensis]